jgi:hypothetical protein
MKREISVAYFKANPAWDNSRNVSVFGKKLYPVTASTLKHLCDVYAVGSPTEDGAGGYKNTLIKRSEEWMSLATLRIEQIFAYRGKSVKATHMFKMRSEVVITESDQIIYENVTYEVIFVDVDKDRRLFKTAMCTELR